MLLLLRREASVGRVLPACRSRRCSTTWKPDSHSPSFWRTSRPCRESARSRLWNRRRTLCSLVRILLDECLPRRLKHALIGHEVQTVPEMGWASKRNGELLRLAAREFDVFLTVDRRLQKEQQLPMFRIAVIVLAARSNRLLDLLPLIPATLEVLPRADPGEATVVRG